MKRKNWAVLTAACMLLTMGGISVQAAEGQREIWSQEKLEELYEMNDTTSEEMEPLCEAVSKSLKENYLEPNNMKPEDFVLPEDMRKERALLDSLQGTYWEYEPDGIEEDIIDEACAEVVIEITLDGKTETISYADLEEDTQEMTKALLLGVLEWQMETESDDFDFIRRSHLLLSWLQHGDIFAE